MNNPVIISLLLAGLTVLSSAQDPAAAHAPLKLDFEALTPGPLPDDFVLTEAEARFSIVAEGGNKMLEMAATPIVDGGVLLGTSIKGGATISARIKATGKRRSYPRFGVGLHGVGGFRCLVVPARKELQIVRNDEVVAQVPWTWPSGTWTTVEFSVLAAAGGGSTLEARAWTEGQPRPETPQLTHALTTPPGTGKASLWAAPYAELPVAFDDVVVTPRP
jgi:hypothetical protein